MPYRIKTEHIVGCNSIGQQISNFNLIGHHNKYYIYILTAQAQKQLSAYVGLGSDKVMVDVYRDMFNDKMVYLTVTKSKCVPVSVTQMDDHSMTFVNFMSITQEIRNLTIFDVPKECMRSTHSSLVST
jgi:hypothetical protein